MEAPEGIGRWGAASASQHAKQNSQESLDSSEVSLTYVNFVCIVAGHQLKSEAHPERSTRQLYRAVRKY